MNIKQLLPTIGRVAYEKILFVCFQQFIPSLYSAEM